MKKFLFSCLLVLAFALSATAQIQFVNEEGKLVESPPSNLTFLPAPSFSGIVWSGSGTADNVPIYAGSLEYAKALNLEVFEKDDQVRYQIYAMAAEFAISGDDFSEAIMQYLVKRMLELQENFGEYYKNSAPALIGYMARTADDDLQRERARAISRRLFDD